MNGLAVVSGKGGVGKSLVASTLIKALSSKYKVGAIDADFSNPNLGTLLKIKPAIDVTREMEVVPYESDGIKFFSIEAIAEDRGISMTGDQYAEIIKDVLKNGKWDVDYLVVDLPAVISSEFKSVISFFEENYLGSIVVAQPSHLATTERVLKLHELNGIPVIGLVENMVSFKCKVCNTDYHLFGDSGIDELASKYGVGVIGKIPLYATIYVKMKGDEPVVIPDKQFTEKLVESVLASKPKKLGFVEEMKKKVKELTRDVFLKIVIASLATINKEVDIKGMQEKLGYQGGETIGLVMMDEKMEKPVHDAFVFRVQDGKVVMVKEPKSIDLWLYIRTPALGWIFTGKKVLPNGKEVQYDLRDAILNGDVKIYGNKVVARAIDFYRNLWFDAKSVVSPKIQPLVAELM